LGKCPVIEDMEAVLRKIEHWHEGSIAKFKIMYRDGKGFWHGVRWDDKTASSFALGETDQRMVRKKLNYWPKLKTSERALASPDPLDSWPKRLCSRPHSRQSNLKSGASRPLDDFYDVFASNSSGHAGILVDASTVWL
jgi:hypothetical protein